MKKITVKIVQGAEYQQVVEQDTRNTIFFAQGEDHEIEVSDGYHTMDELYDHRIELWIAFCRLYASEVEGFEHKVWRSKKHSDESEIEGWFVLGFGKLPNEQITYHLPLARWEDTNFAQTLEFAPEWDGHTSADVIKRLKSL